MFNLFLYFKNLYMLKKKKIKSVSKKDTNQFFLFKKNSDLHLMKMQICFYFKKK